MKQQAFAGSVSVVSLVLLTLVEYSCEQSTNLYSTYTFCSSYCDTKGYWQDGPTCLDYCCGNSTYRYCCGNSSLDVSHKYGDVGSCSCPQNDCYSTPAWEYFVYVVAPITVFTTIALCCCRCGCDKSCKCKKRGDNVATNNRIAAVSRTESVDTLSNAVERNTSPNPYPGFYYTMEPPSYETVTGDLPKYEDIVDESRGHEGPYEIADSAEDLSMPPGEYIALDDPPSEWSNNDALPQPHAPSSHS